MKELWPLEENMYIFLLTPNVDPPKRLSIAHWKALVSHYLVSRDFVRYDR